jgi:hypothetical protein
MKRIGFVFVTTLAMAGVLGCQRDDSSVKEKLDQIDSRLAGIEEKLASGAGAAAARPQQPQQPQRPQPSPTEVYAAPVDGAAYLGPKHAKVTIVEAFTFT